MSLPAVSKHLKVLERAGLITRGREAQWRPCRLEAAPLKEVADWVEHYRGFWEQSFDRLDDYLREMKSKEEKHGPQATQEITRPPTGGSRGPDHACVRRAPRPVFEAWTDPEHLQRWFAPRGCTVHFCRIDFRPGGTFHSCIRTPDGHDCWCVGIYRAIVAPERIVFTMAVADEQATCSAVGPAWTRTGRAKRP